MYAERASRLRGGVLWRRVATGDEVRVLPDGSMDIIWGHAGALFVAGPDTEASIYRARPGTVLTGLRFAPGIGPSVLGVPAHVLRDQRLPLEELWRPADVRRLVDRLAASRAPAVVLETVAIERGGGPDGQDAVHEIVRLLRGGRSVATVADDVGLSERQLRRRSLDAFGYGPKTLARILRANRAIQLAAEGAPFAEVAAEAGFADQAHLAREVRRLAGAPLSRLGG